MKRFVRILVLAVACAAVGASVSCSKKAPVTTPTPPPPPPPKPLTEDELFARKSLADLNAEKPLGDVFFDYDKSTLKDEARASIQKNADWLKRWTSTKILIEGHCDARGTSEYNMALGEKRAAAVRDYVASLGIGADRVMVVSKGKESPFCSEDNEGCWSQNRRGHFIISAK
ncbi:MAG: peptidoglycan-associated lipoprotein Pal [Acidobacteriota bacterium]